MPDLDEKWKADPGDESGQSLGKINQLLYFIAELMLAQSGQGDKPVTEPKK